MQRVQWSCKSEFVITISQATGDFIDECTQVDTSSGLRRLENMFAENIINRCDFLFFDSGMAEDSIMLYDENQRRLAYGDIEYTDSVFMLHLKTVHHSAQTHANVEQFSSFSVHTNMLGKSEDKPSNCDLTDVPEGIPGFHKGKAEGVITSLAVYHNGTPSVNSHRKEMTQFI